MTFSQVGQSIGSGDQADFSLSHGAVQLAAEQALSDLGTLEAEKAAKRWGPSPERRGQGLSEGVLLLLSRRA